MILSVFHRVGGFAGFFFVSSLIDNVRPGPFVWATRRAPSRSGSRCRSRRSRLRNCATTGTTAAASRSSHRPRRQEDKRETKEIHNFSIQKKIGKNVLKKKTHLKTKRGVLPVAHVVAERFVVAQTLFFGHDACKIKRRR